MLIRDTTSVPSRITGKSVEDIAAGLYDALSETHPDVKGFRLDYLIINRTTLNSGTETKSLEADSKDTFIKAFHQYHREGKFLIEGQSYEEAGGTITCEPTELGIYYRFNGQYSDQYYAIPKGVERTSEFFSGFNYHRSLIKRFLINNRLIRGLREKALSEYPKVESFLKDVLKRSNKCIEEVALDPFYITIEQKTKPT